MMRLIDADRLLEERRMHTYYHLPNGDTAVPIVDIQNAPTVEPEQRWIPCSERLPDNEVLCCDNHGEMMLGYVFACDDGKTPYSAENEHEYMYDCVAWMPLPEPYQEGEQDENNRNDNNNHNGY